MNAHRVDTERLAEDECVSTIPQAAEAATEIGADDGADGPVQMLAWLVFCAVVIALAAVAAVLIPI